MPLGNESPDARWMPITEPLNSQLRDAELGVWDVSGLRDTTYVLRLAAELGNGQTLEDRRRLYLDRTAPEVNLKLLDVALHSGHWGILAEAQSDDVVEVSMQVQYGGMEATKSSDRKSRLHGIVWKDESGFGGQAEVIIKARNVAGLTTNIGPVLLDLPPLQTNSALFEETTLLSPAGYLLPVASDLDNDGLKEFVYNRYQDTWLGDTLMIEEWNGDGFARIGELVANFFPRDVGDTDGDGLPELLLQVSAATLVLEFEPENGGVEPVYFDTTGVGNISGDQAVWGGAPDGSGPGWTG